MEKIIEKFFNLLEKDEKGEIFIEERVEKFAESGRGKVEKLQEAQTTEVAIRILKDNRVAFGYFNSLDEKTLTESVKNVRSLLPFQKEKERFSFPPPASFTPIEGIVDTDFENITDKELKEASLELERSAREKDKRITTTRSAKVSAERIKTYIANSEGINYSTENTLYQMEIIVVAEEKGESGDSWGYSWNHFFKNLKNIGEETAEKALKAIGGEIPETGRYPVIIENRAASMLVETLFPAFVAENIKKGRSPLIGKMGEEIFSSDLTIVVDGRFKDAPLPSPFDGEGTVTRRVEIVKNGFLKSWIYDMEYALIDGVEATGSVVREDVKNPPHTGVFNFYVEAGKESLEAGISDIKNGIFITELMGLHTVDPITWQFSLGARGCKIENGKISYPLQQFTIAGDFVTMLKITRPLNDLIFIGGSGAPSLFIEEINIAGK